MAFKLRFAKQASEMLDSLEIDPSQQVKLRKVRRALGRLEQNPRHRGLHSHHYESFPADRDVKVWDSYVENRTPAHGGSSGGTALMSVGCVSLRCCT